MTVMTLSGTGHDHAVRALMPRLFNGPFPYSWIAACQFPRALVASANLQRRFSNRRDAELKDGSLGYIRRSPHVTSVSFDD